MKSGRPANATLTTVEKDNKGNYNKQVLKVDYGTFTLSIFGANECIGGEASIFLAKLVDKISEKTKDY